MLAGCKRLPSSTGPTQACSKTQREETSHPQVLLLLLSRVSNKKEKKVRFSWAMLRLSENDLLVFWTIGVVAVAAAVLVISWWWWDGEKKGKNGAGGVGGKGTKKALAHSPGIRVVSVQVGVLPVGAAWERWLLLHLLRTLPCGSSDPIATACASRVVQLLLYQGICCVRVPGVHTAVLA